MDYKKYVGVYLWNKGNDYVKENWRTILAVSEDNFIYSLQNKRVGKTEVTDMALVKHLSTIGLPYYQAQSNTISVPFIGTNGKIVDSWTKISDTTDNLAELITDNVAEK